MRKKLARTKNRKNGHSEEALAKRVEDQQTYLARALESNRLMVELLRHQGDLLDDIGQILMRICRILEFQNPGVGAFTSPILERKLSEISNSIRAQSPPNA
jgi:hypothetical protein